MRTGVMLIACCLCLLLISPGILPGGRACYAVVDPKPLPSPAENSIVIGHLDADVTGDGIDDRVVLMGRRFDQTGPYMVKLSVNVTSLDGENKLCTCLPGDSDSGCEPQLKAMDFTGDGTPDVFISFLTGGSDGIINCIIYSLKGRKPTLLLDTNRAVISKFKGSLLPNYKARIVVDGKTRIIDLKDRKKYYDQMGYYKKGRLLKPTNVRGGRYGLITPVDTGSDGVYELRAIQEACGIADVDRIAEIISILKWENSGWKVIKFEVKKVGPL